MKIGIIMDPIEEIKPHKDTTLAIMLAAKGIGAELFYINQNDLYLKNNKTYAMMQNVSVFDSTEKWFSFIGEPENKALTKLDVIFMRKDPPVNKRFIHTAYLLEMAVNEGVRVVNNPSSLYRYNEKILATNFPQFCPPYIIGADKTAIKKFWLKEKKIIIKPLDSMGGEGVFLLTEKDMNFDVIWETQTSNGKYPIIAQRFIPQIKDGDKRIIIIDGEPFDHSVVRLPQEGSIRGNLAAGGGYRVEKLTDKDFEIANTVGKFLKKEGILLSGIDIIGDYLTEVNITSPTCLRELTAKTGVDLAKMVVEKALAVRY